MTNRVFSFKALMIVVICAFALGIFGHAQLDKLLKGGGIAVAVDKFGPEINKGINRLTGDKNLSHQQATKVVPILSVGQGEAVGAVQVAGPKKQVDQVKAVLQVEGKVDFIGGIRLRALVPISARSVSNVKRVPGVGVSAIVDIRL